MAGKISNDEHLKLVNKNSHDYDKYFDDQYAGIGGRLRGEYPNQPLKAILYLFLGEEYNPGVDKDTEVHYEFVVVGVFADSLRLWNGPFLAYGEFYPLDRVFENDV